MIYGQELILDLHHCDVATMTRPSIARYFAHIVDAIDMEACDCHFWDDEDVPPAERQTDPKTTGVSAVQFIITSSIVVHALTKLGSVYINLFSCKPFDTDLAADLAVKWFAAKDHMSRVIERTMPNAPH